MNGGANMINSNSRRDAINVASMTISTVVTAYTVSPAAADYWTYMHHMAAIP
jgi:hypothetical protein